MMKEDDQGPGKLPRSAGFGVAVEGHCWVTKGGGRAELEMSDDVLHVVWVTIKAMLMR